MRDSFVDSKTVFAGQAAASDPREPDGSPVGVREKDPDKSITVDVVSSHAIARMILKRAGNACRIDVNADGPL